MFSKRHYRLVSPKSDTPQDIADRLRRNSAAEQAMRERKDRFPVLTAENAQDAIDFQDRRYREILQGGPVSLAPSRLAATEEER